MKKMLFIFAFVLCNSSVLCDQVKGRKTDYYQQNMDLAESVRILTGKVEEIEKKLDELKKDYEISTSEINELKLDKKKQELHKTITGKTPVQLIKIVENLIDENKTEEAREILKVFISKNTGDIFCGMMYFYIGNCYFLEKDYKNAAIAYMEGYKINPVGCKSGETLYKLAICFKKLGKFQNALSTLNKVIQNYSGELITRATAEKTSIEAGIKNKEIKEEKIISNDTSATYNPQ